MLKKRSFVVVLAIVMVLAFSVGVCAAPTFTDIADSWAKDSIEKMAEADVVNGYPDGTFRPNGEVTRAEFAQILYNAVGEKYDVEKIKNPFVDVKSDWYYVPVITLYNDGVINGVTATQFDPNAKLTREQMITMVSRAADIYDCFELTADTSKDIKAFKDADQISSYAVDGFTFGYQTGLINGMDGALVPQGITTRAQVVTVLDRCISAEKVLPLEIAQEDWNGSKKYAQLSTGVTMAYIEMGDAKGEPVVLIHGGSGDTSRTFSLMAPYLAEAGYHLYLVDRKANGDSSAPEYGTYDMWGEAADIAAFIDAMGHEKAHIVGHSFGSLVCQGIQVLYPEKIDKMVYYPNMTWDTSEYVPTTEADLTEEYYASWIDNEVPESEWTDEYRNFLEWEIFDAKRCTADRLNLMDRGSANSDSTVALNDIDTEYLYIWATLDFTPTSEIVKVLSATEKSKFLVYDGVGHNIQWEIPEQLAKDIMAYFEDKTPPTGYADKEYFLETDGNVIRFLESQEIIADYR